jgi:hypothetical protein
MSHSACSLFPLVLIACARLFAAAPDPALLLGLPLDEGTGVGATDRSTSALEADLSNVQWATGAFGAAARFGGTNAFIDLPPVPGLSGATQLTLSVWALWDGPAGRYPNLLTTRTWSPGGLMLFVSDNACSFRLGRPGQRAEAPGSTWTEVGAPLLNALPQRQWVHLCVTFALPRITTYVNGSPVGHALWLYPVEADALRLGGWSGPVCHSGLIDDLRIYGRAFTAPEIAALAHDPSRASSAYAVADESTLAKPLAAAFENRRATLAIDTQGRAVSLRTRAGRELLAEPTPLVSATLKDGRTLTARSVTRTGDALTFCFPRGLGAATIDVAAQRDFFTFAVRSCTLTNAASLTFCSLSVAPSTYCGSMANMLSDDADAVCLRGYDLPVEMSAGGHALRAWSTAALGLVGCRAGLAAGPKGDMPAMLRAMAEAAGAPASKLGGPWSLGAEANRGSYLFADLKYAATDDWIDLARRGGFSTIHLHGWWRTLGHYDVSTNLYPRGLADMRDTVTRIHAAGLRAGIHTLTACIDPRDAWITPEASPHLVPFDTYTLARDLSPTDSVLYVNEPPSARHDTVFTYMSNGNAIRVGSEILQYSEVSREPPYAFARCARGAFKTRPAAHLAGARADYLQQRYIAFYPQPGSPLADDLAGCIANVFNTCKLDQIYFDGSEGMMSRYGIDALRHAIFKRLDGDPLVEASCHGAHNWWFHSRLGAWDHPVWAAKRFHDKHIATSARYRDTDCVEPQMGWWAPRMPTSQARGHFLDEMEYFACKNLGLDAAMSIQGVNVSSAPLPTHIERQFTLLGWYERLRLARYFDTQTVARVAVPGDEFRLRQAPSGAWLFTPVKMSAHRVSRLGNGSEAWTSHNPYSKQPLSARIEALYAAAPYDSPSRVPLAVAADFPSFKIATAASSIALALAEVTTDTKGGGSNLRLQAENKGASCTGAWARATLDFPAPYRTLKGAGALGLWVKGDGSGALLNLQLGTPREYMHALSDHYVTLDFTGWRYVELLVRERDVERMADYVWPYGGAYDIYRNPLDMSHISQVSLYLNSLPPGAAVDVTVSPIMALPTQPVTLKSPALTVNGQTLALPLTLASGDFVELEPDGLCTHFSDRGEPLASLLLPYVVPASAGPAPDGAAPHPHVVPASAGPEQRPTLLPGPNTVAFSCVAPSNASARAEVTLNAFGTPFGTPRPRRMIAWEHLSREYEMPRLITATSSPDNAWSLAVRPGSKARLEIEICGSIADPALTVAGRAIRFPVTLKAGERLLCRDGRRWLVLDATRSEIANGVLSKKVPTLSPGPNRVAFACSSADRATVKLVKVYE